MQNEKEFRLGAPKACGANYPSQERAISFAARTPGTGWFNLHLGKQTRIKIQRGTKGSG